MNPSGWVPCRTSGLPGRLSPEDFLGRLSPEDLPGRLSPEDLLGRDRSPSGPTPQTWRFRRNRPTSEAFLRMPSPRNNPGSPEDLLGRLWPKHLPGRLSPEDFLGRDRSPSGPAPQTWRFRRNRPTSEASLRMPSPRYNPGSRPKTSQVVSGPRTSQVGSRPRTSWVGTDLRAVRRRRRGAFGEIALPRKRS